MSLPAETKFPCVSAPDTDYVAFGFARKDRVQVVVFDGVRASLARVNRAQVESLRDHLTEWLEVAK